MLIDQPPYREFKKTGSRQSDEVVLRWTHRYIVGLLMGLAALALLPIGVIVVVGPAMTPLYQVVTGAMVSAELVLAWALRHYVKLQEHIVNRMAIRQDLPPRWVRHHQRAIEVFVGVAYKPSQFGESRNRARPLGTANRRRRYGRS